MKLFLFLIPMFGIGQAQAYVAAKVKAPLFNFIFEYARHSLASDFDIARRYAEQPG